MKLPVSILAALLVTTTTSSVWAATGYSTDFSGFTTSVDPNPPNVPTALAGQDGWQISNVPATTGLSFVYDYQTTGSTWGALGGHFAIPDQNPTHLTHSVDLPLSALNFSVDFAISSTTFTAPVTQDEFAWSFNSANPGDLFRIGFVPSSSTLLQVFWYDSANTPTAAKDGSNNNIFVSYDSIYTLQVDADPAGADVLATATLIPGVGSPVVFSNTLVGLANETVNEFGADFNATADLGNAGDNTMFFDNLTVVRSSTTTTRYRF